MRWALIYPPIELTYQLRLNRLASDSTAQI